jgi:hypothetical protein
MEIAYQKFGSGDPSRDHTYNNFNGLRLVRHQNASTETKRF